MREKRETVAVIGLGASGDAAARLALLKGAKVHVTDANSETPIAARGAVLRDLGAEVRLGGHDVEKIAAADTVVVSPGIPSGAPVLAALRARGVAWVSEPEFACRFVSSPLTIVTGTNGKTTTAALCAHLLREAGVEAALGGNIGGGLGPPASALAAACPAADRIVLELSSFQLADTRDLTPDVGVMTNLGVDHMDRYATVADYHRDKRRLFEAGDENTTWVVNGDDRAVLAMAEGVPGTHLAFSLETAPSPGAYLSGGDLVLDPAAGVQGPRRVAAARDVRLLGRHNLANALAHQGDTRQAVHHYREALRIHPGLVHVANRLAWILATDPDPALRSGAEAVDLAERFCRPPNDANPMFLDTLAAAYAETGRFPQALGTATRAASLASSMGQPELADQIRQRMDAYRERRPVRYSRIQWRTSGPSLRHD